MPQKETEIWLIYGFIGHHQFDGWNCRSLCEGQTYQETKEVYVKLHQAHGMSPAQAAKVFIDGSEDDYLTSSILAADCKFAEFEVTSFLVTLNRSL